VKAVQPKIITLTTITLRNEIDFNLMDKNIILSNGLNVIQACLSRNDL
jgi:hypothetical protein